MTPYLHNSGYNANLSYNLYVLESPFLTCLTFLFNLTVAVLGGDLYVERRSKLPPQLPAALAGVAGTVAVSPTSLRAFCL